MNKRQRKKNLMKSSPYIVAKKIKPNEAMVIQFDKNDDNFDLDVLNNFVNSYNDIIPKETTYCFTEDYEKYPVKTLHFIAEECMTDWGLPNDFRLY